jgi:hypothetical protein
MDLQCREAGRERCTCEDLFVAQIGVHTLGLGQVDDAGCVLWNDHGVGVNVLRTRVEIT